MIISTLIWGFMLTTCDSDKAEEIIERDFLHGKWQLITINLFLTLEEGNISFDYSQKNIIYEFGTNNDLTVSGDVADTDYRGREIGEHSYEVLPMPPSGPAGPCFEGRPIKIDTETHSVSFGWVSFDFYEGAAMHIRTQKEILVLVRVDQNG